MSDRPPLPIPEAPTGTPLSIPIHPRPPETNTQPLVNSAAPEVPPHKLNHGKRRKVSSAKWEEHKDTLYNLYIVEGLTLEKTMASMEKQHDFQASKAMYRHRFKSWGMFKKSRKANVHKDVARHPEETQNSDSEVSFSANTVSGTRVQRYLTKHGVSIPGKTTSTVPASDANDAGSPMAMGTPAKAPAEKASCALFLPAGFKSPLDHQHFLPGGRIIVIDGIRALQAEVIRLISDGQLNDAIVRLRNALTALQDVFTPTHPNVVGTAWHLVDVCTLIQDIQGADKVIDWMSSGYSKELGLLHPRTLYHYQRVVGKLEAPGRSNDARSLGFRLFTAIRDKAPPTKIISVLQPVVSDDELAGITESPEFQRIFSKPSDVDQMDQQLRLANLWSLARLPGMQLVAQKLILDFGSLPVDLRGREVEARCIYIWSLVDEKALETARSECLIARNILTHVVLHASPQHITELIPLAKELQYMHRIAEDTSGANAMGEWIMDLARYRIFKPFWGIYSQDTNAKLIDHFTCIGLRCQNGFKEREALLWFTFAYKTSINVLGNDHPTSLRLEKAIKDRYYDDGKQVFKGFKLPR
ncbi:Clr5 domain-containing protein [Fusarium sp. LHS14.1]|nr:Clr5 domain-containing protein [Fusarium sp. LHS14.1]